MTFATVVIYHNEDPSHFDGFDAAHNQVSPVFTYATGLGLDPDAAAERAFELFNAPEEYLPDSVKSGISDRQLARDYRALRLRSLSVGDVVQVGRIYLAVDRTGFKSVDAKDLKIAYRPSDDDLELRYTR